MAINSVTLLASILVATAVTMFLIFWYYRAKKHASQDASTELSTSGNQLQTILGNISDAIIIINPLGRILTLNPMAERMFGITAAEVLEKKIETLVSDLKPDKQGNIHAGVRQAVGLRKNGETFQVDLKVCENQYKNSSGLVVVAHDIMEGQLAEQRRAYQAQFDPLTGLPNRTLFYDRAKHALARAYREEKLVAIMYLDLDYFKNVNDALGHHVGDELLKAVSHRITSCLRDVDTVSRMGGDEFTVILESISHIDNATIVAQKIIDVLQEPFRLEEQELKVTASIGITIYPFDDKDLNSLIKDADQAMYRAKESGRNSYQLYGADMAENVAAIKMMETQIQNALERNELLLYYQPRIDLDSGKIKGVEALLRWKHPEMGLIAANDFMPLVERSRLIYEVDEWVLQTACLQNHHWQKIGLPAMRVTVNISPYRFRRKGLVELVDKVLKKTGMAPACLELDIPAENLVGLSQDSYREVLEQLNVLGVHVALADNGVGSSILDTIKKLSLRVMKIHRSFIQDATVDKDQAAVVQALVALAQALKIKVVAEGVETKEQLRTLRASGCDLVQGYLFSKPVESKEITRLVKEGSHLV